MWSIRGLLMLSKQYYSWCDHMLQFCDTVMINCRLICLSNFLTFFLLTVRYMMWWLKQQKLVTLSHPLWQSGSSPVHSSAESLFQERTLLQSSLFAIPIFFSIHLSLFLFSTTIIQWTVLIVPESKAAASELYPPRTAEEHSLLPRQQHKEPVRTGKASWFTACREPHF